MNLCKEASDGTVFRVYEGANGHYIAADDEQGYHYQGHGSSWWTERQAKAKLDEAVSEYEWEGMLGSN